MYKLILENGKICTYRYFGAMVNYVLKYYGLDSALELLEDVRYCNES